MEPKCLVNMRREFDNMGRLARYSAKKLMPGFQPFNTHTDYENSLVWAESELAPVDVCVNGIQPGIAYVIWLNPETDKEHICEVSKLANHEELLAWIETQAKAANS